MKRTGRAAPAHSVSARRPTQRDVLSVVSCASCRICRAAADIRCLRRAQWIPFVIQFFKVSKVDSGLYQAVEHAQRLERSQAMYVINLGESAIL